MRRVDAAAINAYAASFAALGPNATADPGTAARALRPAFERALAAGPSVTLDPVRFTYDGEPITARLEIVTNAAALPAAGALDFEDPAALLALFDCAAEIELSKKLAQQLAGLAMQTQFARDPTLSPEQRRLFAEAQSGLVLVTLVGQGFIDDGGRRIPRRATRDERRHHLERHGASVQRAVTPEPRRCARFEGFSGAAPVGRRRPPPRRRRRRLLPVFFGRGAFRRKLGALGTDRVAVERRAFVFELQFLGFLARNRDEVARAGT